MDIIKHAQAIMKMAHNSQFDKGGTDYYLHPLRVAQEAKKMFNTEYDKFIGECVALLHDVIEDSNLTADDLVNENFENAIVSRVVCMTRKDGESYMDYIKRIGEDNICRIIKMCDLKDNMDVTRLDKLKDEDLNRIKKYHKAYKYLKNLD
jgi:(p)ppGpp synthase/HD superfamily hydrolase